MIMKLYFLLWISSKNQTNQNAFYSFTFMIPIFIVLSSKRHIIPKIIDKKMMMETKIFNDFNYFINRLPNSFLLILLKIKIRFQLICKTARF